MPARFFDGIPWQQAWYATVRPAAAGVVAAADWRMQLNADASALDLRNHRGLPLQFVPQEQLPPGLAYESYISSAGCVPTRENLHDFFNALVWLTFPNIKRQLNALQAAQIAQLGIGKSRGPARDAATIFDENAALLVLADTAECQTLIENLRAHCWQAAFQEQRALWGRQAEVWSFGHALMEKLVQPYKAITAHSWVVSAPAEFFGWEWDAKRAWLDRQVSAQLVAQALSNAAYTPLPVLGIPGWWPGQDAAFYADATVFRPRRSK